MNANILVIDDVEQIRVLAAKILKKDGARVVTAATPAEAISLLKERTTNFDIIFLDILLPGLNGYEVLQIIQEMKLDPAPKICMMSQKGEKEDVSKAIQLGCSDYIVKPFFPEKLIAKAHALLGTLEEIQYAKIALDFPARIHGQAIEPDILLTELTEDSITIRSTAAISSGTVISIHCKQLNKVLETEIDFNINVRECRKVRIGRYFVEGGFVGVSEGTIKKVRSLAIRGIRSLNYS